MLQAHAADTKFFQWAKKDGPYRIAVANGFVGNTWRIQMIKTAKAFVEAADVKPDVKELKVVSTGTDVAAQIAAIDNFINSGYDAIVTIAVNPTAFEPVIKRANEAGVVLVPFDNVTDSTDVMQVNEDQLEMGRQMGRWLDKNIRRAPARSWKCAACRATRSTATVISASARSWKRAARSSRSSKLSATGTTARRRRSSPTRSPCTRSSTACSSRAVPPAPCAR
jgi:ABC-type sugar transport system substrate-binding protein